MYVRRPLAVLVFAACVSAQADPEIQAGFADVALERGDYAEAIRGYTALMRKHPSNLRHRMQLGVAMSLAGRHRDAVPVLEAVTKLDPALTPAWLHLGNSLMELQQAAKAEPALRKYIAADPGHAGARLMMGDVLMALDKPEDAVEHYRRFTAAEPDDPEGWQGLGKAYELSGRRAFDEMQRMEPESAWALALAGEARWVQLDLPAAFWLFRAALKRMPELRGVRPLVARIYRESGHDDWAEKEAAKEALLPPADCSKLRLECDFRAGKFEAVWSDARYRRPVEAHYWMVKASQELSARAYEKLLDLPASVDIHTFLAETYRQQRRHSEEAAQWRAAMRLDPRDAGVKTELAVALFASRDYAGAERLARELLAADPKSARLHLLLGETLLASGKAASAAGPLGAALQLDPTLPGVRAATARALMASGRAGEALPHLEAALPEDQDGALHVEAARIYQVLGRTQDAARATAKFQQLRAAQSAERRAPQSEVKITPP